MRKVLIYVAALSLGGCATALPVSPGFHVDPQTAPSCTNVCRQVGMKVGAIVFIGSMGGCVCEPEVPAAKTGEKTEAGSRAASGSGAVAGGALAAIQAAQQQQQQQAGQRGNPSIPSIR